MLSYAIVALTVAAGSVLGAPLEARYSYSNSTSPGHSTPTPDPTPSGYFQPSSVSTYDVSNGAIQCEVSYGLVDKATDNKGRDFTTLMTFTYPEGVTGKQCLFEFFLDEGASLYGSKKVDLYTSLAPAPGCTSGWAPGNQRNVNLGRMSVQRGGLATWDATYSAYLTKRTPCKAPGTVEAFELVGVYDNDHVSWNVAVAGARISYI
ncbi:hypothetical protein BN1723_003986, partial [Verticillium longisporum]